MQAETQRGLQPRPTKSGPTHPLPGLHGPLAAEVAFADARDRRQDEALDLLNRSGVRGCRFLLSQGARGPGPEQGGVGLAHRVRRKPCRGSGQAGGAVLQPCFIRLRGRGVGGRLQSRPFATLRHAAPCSLPGWHALGPQKFKLKARAPHLPQYMKHDKLPFETTNEEDAGCGGVTLGGLGVGCR